MRIDHIEIFVSDRQQAAEWYEKVFGFMVDRELADWAEDPRGPLIIANQDRQLIALFTGPAQGDRQVCGIRRLAFQVDAAGFIQFVETSGQWIDPPLGLAVIQDHIRAFSVYFSDPDGNPLEVTTYDYDEVKVFVDSLAEANNR